MRNALAQVLKACWEWQNSHVNPAMNTDTTFAQFAVIIVEYALNALQRDQGFYEIIGRHYNHSGLGLDIIAVRKINGSFQKKMIS